MVGVNIEMSAATVAALQTLVHTHPQGFRGILVGRLHSSCRTHQTDEVNDVVDNCVQICVSGCLGVENEEKILFPGYSIAQKNFKDFVKKSLSSDILKDLRPVGLLSYSPFSDTPSLKDLKFTSQIHPENERVETILLHVYSEENIDSLSYFTKMFVYDQQGDWVEVGGVEVPQLGLLQPQQYFKHTSLSTEKMEDTEAECIGVKEEPTSDEQDPVSLNPAGPKNTGELHPECIVKYEHIETEGIDLKQEAVKEDPDPLKLESAGQVDQRTGLVPSQELDNILGASKDHLEMLSVQLYNAATAVQQSKSSQE